MKKDLRKTIKQVAKIDRKKFFRDQIREKKDPQTMLMHCILNLALSHLFWKITVI